MISLLLVSAFQSTNLTDNAWIDFRGLPVSMYTRSGTWEVTTAGQQLQLSCGLVGDTHALARLPNARTVGHEILVEFRVEFGRVRLIADTNRSIVMLTVNLDFRTETLVGDSGSLSPAVSNLRLIGFGIPYPSMASALAVHVVSDPSPVKAALLSEASLPLMRSAGQNAFWSESIHFMGRKGPSVWLVRMVSADPERIMPMGWSLNVLL
jgi:hypothetical protein